MLDGLNEAMDPILVRLSFVCGGLAFARDKRFLTNDLLDDASLDCVHQSYQFGRGDLNREEA